MKNTIDIVLDILSNKLMHPKERLVHENFNKALTGQEMGLDAITMVYLLLEVEKAFEIKIQQEDIIDYKFNTIECICNIVDKYKISV